MAYQNANSNPSFETPGGTVEVRRNRVLNPRQVSGGSTAEVLSRWSWTRSYISNFNGQHGVATACRMTSPSSETTGTGRGVDLYSNIDNAPGTSGSAIAQPVTTGETLHLECSFAMSFSGSASLVSRFHDGAGKWVSTTVYGSLATPSGIGVVTTVSMDVLVPAGAAYLSAKLSITGANVFPANSTIDISEIYIGAPGDYLDGSYSPDPDLTPSWTGTENASASVLTASRVNGVVGGWQSTQWATSDTHSLRVPDGQVATLPIQGVACSIVARHAAQVATLGLTTATSTTDDQTLILTGTGTLTLSPGWWDMLVDTTDPHALGPAYITAHGPTTAYVPILAATAVRATRDQGTRLHDAIGRADPIIDYTGRRTPTWNIDVLCDSLDHAVAVTDILDPALAEVHIIDPGSALHDRALRPINSVAAQSIARPGRPALWSINWDGIEI